MTLAKVVHHDFDAGRKSTPSCAFTLAGREWHCRASSEIPWSFTRDLLLAQTIEKESTSEQIVRVENLFRGVLVPEEVDAFMQMLDAPDSALTTDLMPDIIKFVTENVLNRPTKRPTQSARGPRSAKTGSRASSSDKATPKRASTG